MWVGGRRSATVSALDRGLTLGDGLFETLLVRHGRAFLLERHLDRLRRSAARLGLPVPSGLERKVERALDRACREGISSGVLRITLTRGAGPPGLALGARCEPTLIVAVNRLDPRRRHAPIHACWASGRRDERGRTAGLKTLSYAEAVMALEEARASGYDEALFLDGRGRVSEATSSNVFAVTEGGTLVTPSSACGALLGITRGMVLRIGEAMGLRTREGRLFPRDLLAAREAFLTSSVRGVVPLVAVEGRPIGDGRPGPLTRRIRAAYGGLLRREIGPPVRGREARAEREPR